MDPRTVIAENAAAAATIRRRQQWQARRKALSVVTHRRTTYFVKQTTKCQALTRVSAKIWYFGYNSMMLKSQTAQIILIIQDSIHPVT